MSIKNQLTNGRQHRVRQADNGIQWYVEEKLDTQWALIQVFYSEESAMEFAGMKRISMVRENRKKRKAKS